MSSVVQERFLKESHLSANEHINMSASTPSHPSGANVFLSEAKSRQ